MATLESGKAKYARKTAPGGPGEAKYNASKGIAAQRWREGLTAAGLPPGPISTQAYQAGMAAASYRGGDPELWARRTREGISR